MGGGKEVPSNGDIMILLPVVQIRKKNPLLKLRSWSIAENIDSLYAWKFRSKASKNALHENKNAVASRMMMQSFFPGACDDTSSVL